MFLTVPSTLEIYDESTTRQIRLARETYLLDYPKDDDFRKYIEPYIVYSLGMIGNLPAPSRREPWGGRDYYLDCLTYALKLSMGSYFCKENELRLEIDRQYRLAILLAVSTNTLYQIHNDFLVTSADGLEFTEYDHGLAKWAEAIRITSFQIENRLPAKSHNRIRAAFLLHQISGYGTLKSFKQRILEDLLDSIALDSQPSPIESPLQRVIRSALTETQKVDADHYARRLDKPQLAVSHAELPVPVAKLDLTEPTFNSVVPVEDKKAQSVGAGAVSNQATPTQPAPTVSSEKIPAEPSKVLPSTDSDNDIRLTPFLDLVLGKAKQNYETDPKEKKIRIDHAHQQVVINAEWLERCSHESASRIASDLAKCRLLIKKSGPNFICLPTVAAFLGVSYEQ